MTKKLTYSGAIATLRHALKFGINPSLEPMRALCKHLDSPELCYPCIQIAGTNGKSSTARFIAALIHERGFKVGLYTSPHLIKYPERFEIDGHIVSDRLFTDAISIVCDAAQRANLIDVTEFEILTAAALWIFAHERVDWAVLECGLGGRWDATSIVNPRVAVITSIGLEHTKILGDTIEKIATEKAAIIKPGSTAVLAYNLPAREVFEEQIEKTGAYAVDVSVRCTDKFYDVLKLFPQYQTANIATAFCAAETALNTKLWSDAVRHALSHLQIPGRFEVLQENPLLIVDAAHNPQGAKTLANEVRRRFRVGGAGGAGAAAGTGSASDSPISRAQAKKPAAPVLLLGVLADKDVRGVVNALCPLFDKIMVTASRSTRSIHPKQLARMVYAATGRMPQIAADTTSALQALRGQPILATGSITICGEIKKLYTGA